MLFWVTPAVACLMLAWAISRTFARQWAVARLFRASRPAGPRLAAAVRRLGRSARELPTAERECFVAGVLRPTVFVSRGALEGLDDCELNAALHHERAHIRGGDTRALFVLGLLRDLAPWGRGEALRAFLAAREARADREAACRASRLDLASALLALARPGGCPAAVLPMADSEGLNHRLQTLLEGEPPSPQGWAARTAGALGVNSCLAAWPILQFELCMLFCSL
jgi:Zn-dependent protease with chaperone function